MKTNDTNFNSESDFPLDHKGKIPFDLPENYFSSFEDNLRLKLEDELELKDFPLLNSISKRPVFTVPGNYFNTIEQSLEYQMELMDYPKLQTISKPAVLSPLEGYETYLETTLSHRVALTDELIDYPTLYSFDKTNPFNVSEHYFDGVSDIIKERVYASKTVNTSILEKTLDFIFGKKLAFTFGLLFIAGLSFYFNRSHEFVDPVGDCKTLACLEKQEILNSRTLSNFDEEQLMDLVDINSLGKQLNLNEQKTDSLSANPPVHKDTVSDELLDAL